MMENVPALMYNAINEGDVEEITRLIAEHPEQLNATTFMAGQTWLGYAAQIGNLDSVKALYELGSDINIGDRYDGSSPLCSACLNGKYEVAKYLINNGSEISTDLSVRNPLFSSIIGRSPDCVKLILDAGIESQVIYNTGTMKDMDALAFALMHGESQCAEIIALRNAKGDRNAADLALNYARSVALKNAHARMELR